MEIQKKKAINKLEKIDTYFSLDFPKKVLNYLLEKDIIPYFILQSLEDAIVFEFDYDETYHLIEFYPDGDIVLLKRRLDKKGPIDAWDLTEKTLLEKLELVLNE